MKTFPEGLETLLLTKQFVFADLYDFTLTDSAGTHLRYTTADTDVFYGPSPAQSIAAQNFLARTSGLTQAQKNAYINFINGLVAAGLFTKFDALWLFAGPDPTTACLNLISASYTAVLHGAPAFTTYSGFQGVDSSATVFIDTQYNPATAAGVATQNNMHISALDQINEGASGVGGGAIMGNYDSSPQVQGAVIYPMYNDGKCYGGINDKVFTPDNRIAVANASPQGFYVMTRNAAATEQLYKNAALIGSGTGTSQTVLSDNIYLLALNAVGVSGSASGGRIGMASIGSALSAGDVSTFYALVQTFMTAITAPLVGNIFTSKGPFFDTFNAKATAHWKAGLDVDSWALTVSPFATDPITGLANPATILGQPFLSAIRSGALRGAVVDIHRAYWARWPVPWSSPLVPDYVLVDLFAGRVADTQAWRTSCIININSFMEMLTRPMPRNVFQAPCRHTLFDHGCTLLQSAFGVAGTVSTVVNSGSFTTGLTNGAGYFALGQLVWLTGANAGFRAAIRTNTPQSSIVLLTPMPYAVQVGDTFTGYPGCDKQQTTCSGKFANLANFGGFPYIPAPETAV